VRAAIGTTPEAGYRVQKINTARWLAEGRRIVGRKIGLTSPAVQKQLGVDQPDFGVLFADMQYQNGEPIPWRRLQQPRAEAEIALVLDKDLTAEAPTHADIIAASAYAAPAIEIVGSRIANWDITIADTIADNASSGAFIVGVPATCPGSLDLSTCIMEMTRDGRVVSSGAGAACLGHPLNAAAWLARKQVELGTPLRAGDVILTGALGPMIAAAPGDLFEATISGLGKVCARFGGEDT
jgi:2-keto-4-pentenoate hydratase